MSDASGWAVPGAGDGAVPPPPPGQQPVSPPQRPANAYPRHPGVPPPPPEWGGPVQPHGGDGNNNNSMVWFMVVGAAVVAAIVIMLFFVFTSGGGDGDDQAATTTERASSTTMTTRRSGSSRAGPPTNEDEFVEASVACLLAEVPDSMTAVSVEDLTPGQRAELVNAAAGCFAEGIALTGSQTACFESAWASVVEVEGVPKIAAGLLGEDQGTAEQFGADVILQVRDECPQEADEIEESFALVFG